MRKRKIFLSRFIVAMLVIAMCACSTEEPKKPADATSSTFTDSRDGNVYKYVQIGNQVWMAENLRYLPSVVGGKTQSETIPYYYVYNYDGSNVDDAKSTTLYKTYGVLYNWNAVQTACPSGWHLPTNAEWETLENYLADNGYNYDGTIGGGNDKIAKALASKSGWSISIGIGDVGNSDFPNFRNKSGFAALPGGFCNSVYYDGFTNVGKYGYWWSSIGYGLCIAWDSSDTQSGFSSIDGSVYNWKLRGFSCRCVKD